VKLNQQKTLLSGLIMCEILHYSIYIENKKLFPSLKGTVAGVHKDPKSGIQTPI
jgi:hypothetical protein